MESDQVARPAASRRTLLMILTGGVIAAGLLLTCVVLPAEYGIDPLGTGKALGLTGLAQASGRIATNETPVTETTAASAAVDPASIVPVLQPDKIESRWGEAASVTGAFIAQPERFRLDSREITLEPFEGLEIKYHMSEGAGVVYSWTASSPVLYDFHGQPDVPPPNAASASTEDDYFESYEHDDVSGKTEFHGTLVAPSTGIEGWFWENASADTVTIKLVAAGFFDWVFQNRGDQVTRLKPMDAYSLASHPQVPDEPL